MLKIKKPLLDDVSLEEVLPERKPYLALDWLNNLPIWLRVALALAMLLFVGALIWQYFAPTKIWQANTRAPLDQMDLKEEATLLYRQSQLKEAIPKLEQVVRENSKDLKARELLVSSYWQQGDLSKALEHNAFLVKHKRFDAATLYRQGLLALQLNKVKTALKYLEQAASQAPNASNYHAELARALTKAKLYDQAANEWRYVLEILSPESKAARAIVRLQLADVYLSKGEELEALEIINKGLEADPNNASLKAKLAQIKNEKNN